MNKKKMTVEDLILKSTSSISLKEASEVLGWGYKKVLEMAKKDEFPYEKCIIKLGNGKYTVMRVRLLAFITGENYEEQLLHKKRIQMEREHDLKNYSDEGKQKIDKIISTIKE